MKGDVRISRDQELERDLKMIIPDYGRWDGGCPFDDIIKKIFSKTIKSTYNTLRKGIDRFFKDKSYLS